MSSITTHPSSRVGDRVIYKLTDFDARDIVAKRLNAGRGTVTGNEPREGDEYPAVITRDWAKCDQETRDLYDSGEVTTSGEPMNFQKYVEQATVNLQVFLDGNDVYWATSRSLFLPEKHGSFALDMTVSHTSAPTPASPRTTEWIPDAKGHWFKL